MDTTQDLEIKIRRIDPGMEIPSYAYEGDAGLDLASAEDVVIYPFRRALVSTGLAVSIPEGYAGFVLPRSGTSLKLGLTMVNTPGLVDSHYRGELKIAAINLDPDHKVDIHRGDRIAQLVIMRTPNVRISEVDSLDATTRGEGGFGSSGI